MNPVTRAMRAIDDQDEYAEALIEEAIAKAIEQPPSGPAKTPVDDPAIQRQRDLDHALADATECVARHRARLGRRVCSRHDATIIRQMHELLRSMMDASGGADTDSSWV